MDIVDELKDSYSFLGDPLHRKAWEEIERLRKENAELKELLQATVDYTGAAASSPNLKFYPAPKWHIKTNGTIQEITITKATGGE